MPIKQGAFGSAPASEEPKPKPKPAKRSRRKKEELIEAVVVPGLDDTVEVKFTATGTKSERPWRVAVELFREDKVEFVTKDPDGIDLKYAVERMDRDRAASDGGGQQEPDPDPDEKLTLQGLEGRWRDLQEKFQSASDAELIEAITEEQEQVRQKIIEMGGEDPMAPDLGAESGKKGSENVPPEAEIGDEVTIGAETYRVGHGGVLTSGPIEVDGEIVRPKRRWQRELGAGGKGAWEVREVFSAPTNGNASDSPKDLDVRIERQIVDPEMREIAPGVWKVGTGVLEKIGLPDYSGFQIGPNTMSTAVLDDGRRTKAVVPAPTLPGGTREVVVPTAVVEKYAECADTVEYVSRLQRQHLIAFLEAVKPGSTQPQT